MRGNEKTSKNEKKGTGNEEAISCEWSLLLVSLPELQSGKREEKMDGQCSATVTWSVTHNPLRLPLIVVLLVAAAIAALRIWMGLNFKGTHTHSTASIILTRWRLQS